MHRSFRTLHEGDPFRLKMFPPAVKRRQGLHPWDSGFIIIYHHMFSNIIIKKGVDINPSVVLDVPFTNCNNFDGH